MFPRFSRGAIVSRMTTTTFVTLLLLAAAWVVYALSGRGKPNKVLENVIVFGIFVTPFIPLVVSPSLFFPFIAGKNFLFRIVVEVIAAAWVILMIRAPQYRPKRSSVFWAFLALSVTMLVSALFGADAFRSFWSNFERMEGYVTLIHLFAFFLAAASVISLEGVWDKLLKTILGVSVYVCLYGTLQLLGFLTINQGGVRLDGTFGNATYLAVYCIFAVFFAAILSVREQAKKISKDAMWWSIGALGFALALFLLSLTQATIHSPMHAALVGILIAAVGVSAVVLAKKYSVAWIYAGIGLFNLVILYYTATRGAILGLIGALILMAIIVLAARKGGAVLRKSALAFLVVVVLGAGGFIALKKSSFVQSSPVLSRFASIDLSNSETTARFHIWNMAWQGFLERPVFGWGQDNFNLVFNSFYEPQLYNQEQWFDRTHDIFFDWLVTGGALGFAAYFSLFGLALYVVWKKTQISFTEKTLFTGLFAAYLVNNIFVFDNITSLVPYVTVLAYIHGIGSRPFARLGSDDTAVTERFTSHVVAPITIAVFATVMYFVNYQGYMTGRNLIGALIAVASNDVTGATASFEKAAAYDSLGREEVTEQIVEASQNVVSSSVSLQTREAYASFAQSIVERQLSQTPSDAREWLFAGNFFALVGADDRAEAAYKQAMILSPNKQTILFSLGSEYLSEKKFDQALALFKQAYDLDHADTDALKWYIAAAVYDGQASLAGQLFASSTPDVAFSDTVARAYLNADDYASLVKIFQGRIASPDYYADTPQNHTSLVAAYVKLGLKNAAIAEVKNLVKLYPNYASVGAEAIANIEAGKPLQ